MVDPQFFTRDFFQSESRLMREVGISGTDTMITLPKEWGTPSCSGGQFRWLKLVHLRRQNKKRHERLKKSIFTEGHKSRPAKSSSNESVAIPSKGPKVVDV